MRDTDRLRALREVLRVDRGARPNQSSDWRRRLHALEHDRPGARTRPLLGALLTSLAESVPLPVAAQELTGGFEDGRPLLVREANTVCAVNVVWAAVELDLQDATALIGRILVRAISEPWTVPSVRVRNACANALAEIGSRQAVDLLAEAASRAQTKALRQQLLLCVDAAANRSEQPPSRLAELRVTHHGLNKQGGRELTVHRYRYRLGIDLHGQVSVARSDGAATASEAASRVVEAEARAIRAAYRKEVARIEALLATERDWDPEDWQRIYLDNPITGAVAGRLIWRRRYEGGRTVDRVPAWVRHGFVVDSVDGTHRTEDVRPEEGAPFRISLWHPRDVEPEMLAAWREACSSHGLKQPFPQVTRDFTRLAPESDATELAQYAATAVEADRFAAAVRRLDWHSRRSRAGARSDAIRLVYRDFPDSRVSVTVPCPESGDAVVLGSGWFHRTEDRARTPLPLGAIAPRVYSEAVRDISVLANGNPLADPEISDAIDYQMPRDEVSDSIE